MAWEKVNWNRSKANQSKATDENTKLICSIVDTGGEGRRGEKDRHQPTTTSAIKPTI